MKKLQKYSSKYRENVSLCKCNSEKKDFPTCNILGVEIAAVSMQWLLTYFEKNIKSTKENKLAGDYICVSNVHTTVISYEDETFRRIQNGACMALPDGGPLSSVGRRRGYSDMSRITGPGLMEELFNQSGEIAYRHYFYGSTRETLQKLEKRLHKRYPNINIAGVYSPPFRILTSEENEMIVQQINEAKPDFVWVGLGAPKQERWMANHQGKIQGLMIGVGAGFDYFSGNLKRAPRWMQVCNLEWLYRLIQEPRRLFKRYLVTNTKFIWHAVICGR